MKKLLLTVALLSSMLLVGCEKKSDYPVVKINDLEIQMDTTTWQDIEDEGYKQANKKDKLYQFQKEEYNIYVSFAISEDVKSTNEKDGVIYYLGLDVDDNTSIMIDDLNITNISKEELAKEYKLDEFNDLVHFEYDKNHFVCLSYDDHGKLDGFAILRNMYGNFSKRDVSLDYRD